MPHEQIQNVISMTERADNWLLRTDASRMMGAGVLAIAQVGVMVAGARTFEHQETRQPTVASSIDTRNLLATPAKALGQNRNVHRHHAEEVQPTEAAPSPKPSPTQLPYAVLPRLVTRHLKPGTDSTPSAPPPRPAIAARPALEKRGSPTRVADESYPPSNCDAEIPSDIKYGIIGINGGKPKTHNPPRCLQKEVHKFLDWALYANAANPDEPNPYQYGFEAGVYDARYALKEGVYRPMWWVDVETQNSWSADKKANVKSIRGIMNGIRYFAAKHGLAAPRFGIYSAQVVRGIESMYHRITNNWRPKNPANRLPSWSALGECNSDDDFMGGGTVLIQGQENGVDVSTLCPGYTLQDVL